MNSQNNCVRWCISMCLLSLVPVGDGQETGGDEGDEDEDETAGIRESQQGGTLQATGKFHSPQLLGSTVCSC